MTFGGQTVTFVSFTHAGDVDALGIRPDIPVEVEVAGCHFRPLSATETPQTEIDIATQLWRCTAPPEPAVLSVDATGYLKYGGNTFAIIGGPQPFTDMQGDLYKVTILAHRQEA